MFEPDNESDAAAVMLERRWFASMTALQRQQAQCDAWREVMTLSARAWREAHKELMRLESLHEALGDALSGVQAERDERKPRMEPVADRRVPSAA